VTTIAKSKAATKLDQIAATMYSDVTAPGAWTRTKLAHGLDIILQRVDEHHWRLALAREGIYPSDTEIAICRESFDVPPAAEESRKQKVHHHPKTKRTIVYHVAELTWIEQQ
jgi:hypothetical protein